MPRRTTVILATLAPIGCLLHLGVVLTPRTFGMGGMVLSYPAHRNVVASPDGAYVARYQYEGCGGATGNVSFWVDLRSEADGRSIYLLYSREPPLRPQDGLKLTWTR